MSKPYCCPVCYGRGKVDCDFYSRKTITSSVSDETCRSCNGTGIVYEKDEVEK